MLIMSKREILKTALMIFGEKGPKSSTMNEIAKSLGISKKTLYKEFSNKAALVSSVYTLVLNHSELKIRRILDKADNAVIEFLNLSKLILSFQRYLSPKVVKDLKQTDSAVYEEVCLFNRAFLPTVFAYNIERGIDTGLYQKKINSNIISHIVLAQLAAYRCELTRLRDQYSGKEIQQQLLAHLLYGMTTLDGGSIASQQLSHQFSTIQV